MANHVFSLLKVTFPEKTCVRALSPTMSELEEK